MLSESDKDKAEFSFENFAALQVMNMINLVDFESLIKRNLLNSDNGI